jgi:hypothetical protein
VAELGLDCLIALGWGNDNNAAIMVRTGAGKVIVRMFEVYGEDTDKISLLTSTAKAFCMLATGSDVDDDVYDLMRFGGGKCLQTLILRHFSNVEMMSYVVESIAQLAFTEVARYELVANQFDKLMVELAKKHAGSVIVVEPVLRGIGNLACSSKVARQMLQNVELPVLLLAVLRLHIRDENVIDSGAKCIETLAMDDLGVLALLVLDTPKVLREALVVHSQHQPVATSLNAALKCFNTFTSGANGAVAAAAMTAAAAAAGGGGGAGGGATAAGGVMAAGGVGVGGGNAVPTMNTGESARALQMLMSAGNSSNVLGGTGASVSSGLGT